MEKRHWDDTLPGRQEEGTGSQLDSSTGMTPNWMIRTGVTRVN
ncbi:hypothetical protein [Wolbachia endosymbiont of Atemnus politus]|nr:hypothetical protein [Wolbachia endosymbiont of Atemnus politus]